MADRPMGGAPPKKAAAWVEGPRHRRLINESDNTEYNKKQASDQQQKTPFISDNAWFADNPYHRYRVRRVVPDDHVYYLLGESRTADTWLVVDGSEGYYSYRTFRLLDGGRQ